MSTAIYSHPDCLRHEMGDWHPECPARLDAISDQLLSSGLMPFLVAEDAPAGGGVGSVWYHLGIRRGRHAADPAAERHAT